jgi:DNA helicase-2/ATP-dependent DNA helicase PcrA
METKIFRIYGPPGTGKTTTLLNKVDQALSAGVDPAHIGYFAFTRQAANEAADRACSRFGFDRSQLPWFRTIHSFALRLSGIRQEQVMQPEHYKELGAALGFDLNVEQSGDDVFDLSKNNNPVISIINLARLRKVDLRDQYDRMRTDEPWNKVKYISDSLTEYKNRFEVYDFTDMLEVFVKEGFCPRLALTFIDEAQDLSPLQWDVAHALEKHSEKIYAAGDDDQAIYRWAGADVEHFISLNGGYEVLEQSYRVPASVHKLAERVANRIERRVVKNYLPKQDVGHVERLSDPSMINYSDGSWLVLAQAAYFLNDITHELKSRGHLFSYRGRRSISEALSDAVNGWEQLRKGKQVTGSTARTVYSYMSVGDRVKRGFKKLPALADDELVTLDELIADHGLVEFVHVVGTAKLEENIRDCLWHTAMDKLPSADRAYITALLRRGEKFNAEPRIHLSTIHGSKGGEADNVVLFTGVSPAAAKAAETSPDDLHRVFYVGITRTKQNLFLVEPQDSTQAYQI